MQKEEYLIKNACYSVTKYYLCKQNNKRSLLGRKQRNQVASSFPNRYLFSFTNKVTCLFSIRYTLINIFASDEKGLRSRREDSLIGRRRYKTLSCRLFFRLKGYASLLYEAT